VVVDMHADDRGRAVVVGCDGSWESERAVVAGTHEAALRGCALVLVCVADDRAVEQATLSRIPEVERDAIQAARLVVDRAESIARATEPSVDTELLTPLGSDSPELADLRSRAVMLVLGGHGAHGQVAFSLGTISAELTRLLPCPVLVPRLDRWSTAAHTGRAPSVLLGLDEGPAGRAIAALAVAEANLRECPLVVVTATAPHAREVEGVLREEWERAWSRIRTIPGAEDVQLRVVVARDDAATALITEANEDDIMVVGTRGGGTLAGLVSGSVARSVLDALPCDVLVVPPSALSAANDDGAPTGARAQVGH
jgi:nucleotide-binding universal stress UspA family protein